ncbi:Hypothetical protein CINCED_3A016002 [Cinara cedri]|uniref:Uncharacterized protein n=1 Tax=Cinara cedri TaxID=506608 RepID=A0A5E4NNG9_9HEMI|nr:Hypothetical protein CINCED_3A016002 [Cinara cedri]
MFFCSWFLPENLVGNVFSCLIKNALTENFDFADYTFDSYVFPDAVFPLILWAGEPPEELGTTNGLESFHRHYNSQFYISHPSIHEVVNILLDVRSETYLKIKSNKKNLEKNEKIN